VARAQRFLDAEFSEPFKVAYAALQADQQKGVDKTVMALLKQQTTPGTRVKPIEPDKYYYEARVNDGDRLIHRQEGQRLLFVDVVAHDEIGKYVRAPKQDKKPDAPRRDKRR